VFVKTRTIYGFKEKPAAPLPGGLPCANWSNYQGPPKATRRAFREGLGDRAKTRDQQRYTSLMTFARTLARKRSGEEQVCGILCGAKKLASKMM
jgi:hypothetical protein